MKKLFIVANWKCNKTVGEAEEWIEQFSIFNFQFSKNLEIILCPPFTLLYSLKLLITNYQLPIILGAQDVSPFPDGAYTGEVSARMLKDLGVEYVIIGHSERRRYFKEGNQVLENKIREVIDFGLIPIFCVQNSTDPVPRGVKIVAYEPVFAIGTGSPDTPENAEKQAEIIKNILGQEIIVLYGGSVNEENVAIFCQQKDLSGVLIGGASLDPEKFIKIINYATKI